MANISNESEPQSEALGLPTKVVLYVFLLFLSLLGNTLVVAVILRTNHLRTHFNYLIVNMSVSDFVVPLVAVPLLIIQETALRKREWLVDGVFGNILCKLCFFVIDISPAVSVLTLVLISVNRFLVTTFPIRRQVFSRKVNKILIAAVWVIAMLFFSPYFYAFQVRTYEYTVCVLSWSSSQEADNLAHTIFMSLHLVSFFILPYTVIFLLYTCIVLKLRKNSVEMREMLNHDQLVSRRQKNKQIITMSIIIIITFGLFWGPYYVFMFLANFIWQWDFPPLVKANISVIAFAVTYAGYFNSVINPWIYFIFLKSYRTSLKRLLLKGRKKTNNFRLNNFGSSTRTQSAKSGLTNEPSKSLRITTTLV